MEMWLIVLHRNAMRMFVVSVYEGRIVASGCRGESREDLGASSCKGIRPGTAGGGWPVLFLHYPHKWNP
jgi:hypothetical protein